MSTHYHSAPAPLPRWLTLQAAAGYCGLSTRTLSNYVRAGLLISSTVALPGTRRGRRLLCRESLDRFIEDGIGQSSQVNPPAQKP